MLTLRKGSKKDICPNCGKRSFTPYVDENGEIFNRIVGRCDRENKCNYHYSPKDFYYDNPSVKRPAFYKTALQIKERQPVLPLGEIEKKYYLPSIGKYEANPLARYLHKVFDPLIGKEKVDCIFMQMGFGTSKLYGGAAVFWLIDANGRIRDGKIMGYNPTTGKRIKHPYPQINNAHTQLYPDVKREWRPCMFGTHLAAAAKDKEIWIFESEKAALICALAFEWLGCWMAIPVAVGGCSALNPKERVWRDQLSRLEFLRGRDIVLFPDEGMYLQWSSKLSGFHDKCGRVLLSTVTRKDRIAQKVDCEINPGEGFDDLILRYIERGLDLGDLLINAWKGDANLPDEFWEEMKQKSIKQKAHIKAREERLRREREEGFDHSVFPGPEWIDNYRA